MIPIFDNNRKGYDKKFNTLKEISLVLRSRGRKKDIFSILKKRTTNRENKDLSNSQSFNEIAFPRRDITQNVI